MLDARSPLLPGAAPDGRRSQRQMLCPTAAGCDAPTAVAKPRASPPPLPSALPAAPPHRRRTERGPEPRRTHRSRSRSSSAKWHLQPCPRTARGCTGGVPGVGGGTAPHSTARRWAQCAQRWLRAAGRCVQCPAPGAAVGGGGAEVMSLVERGGGERGDGGPPPRALLPPPALPPTAPTRAPPGPSRSGAHPRTPPGLPARPPSSRPVPPSPAAAAMAAGCRAAPTPRAMPTGLPRRCRCSGVPAVGGGGVGGPRGRALTSSPHSPQRLQQRRAPPRRLQSPVTSRGRGEICR